MTDTTATAFANARATCRAFRTIQGVLASELEVAKAADNEQAVLAVEATIRFASDAARDAELLADEIEHWSTTEARLDREMTR